MSGPKWAPAPWKADFGEAYRIRDADGGQIAIVTHLQHGSRQGWRRPIEQVAATAHLVSAAPELYEALRNLTYNVDEYGYADVSLFEHARETLAKAQGETS